MPAPTGFDPRVVGQVLAEHGQDLLSLVAETALEDELDELDGTRRSSFARPRLIIAGPWQRLPEIELSEMRWLLRCSPPVGVTTHPELGRLLVVGEYQRGGLRCRARVHRPVGRPVEDCGRAITTVEDLTGWSRPADVPGALRLSQASSRFRVYGIPHVAHAVGRHVVTLDGRIVEEFTAWFATSETRGPVVLPRENWESVEPRFRGMNW
jgi:hypothetical protein